MNYPTQDDHMGLKAAVFHVNSENTLYDKEVIELSLFLTGWQRPDQPTGDWTHPELPNHRCSFDLEGDFILSVIC